MILKETVSIYKTGGSKGDVTKRLQRGLCNDMYKLFESINDEINALPPEKRSVIWNDFLDLLNDRVKEGVFTPPPPKHPETLIIDYNEIADEKAYKRTGDENFHIANALKGAIFDMKMKHPKDIIYLKLLDSDSLNAKILNVLAKGVASDYQDEVVLM